MGFFDFFKRKPKQIIPTQNPKVKVGLALGGGATRGFGHIGVIKAFEEAGITFDYVAGTSAGSIVGALYSAGFNSNQLEEIAKTIRKKDIKTNRTFMPSKATGIEAVVKTALGDVTFETLKIPFSAVAVDLISSEEVIITKGDLAKCISASCAVPGVFVPVEYENMHLSDGGLQNNIPSDVPRMFGCDYVIAVDVNSTRGEGTDSFKALDVLFASFRIMSKSNSVKGYLNADIVIQPNLKKFKSTKVDGLDEMIEEGYFAAKEKMPQILQLLSQKPKTIKQLVKFNDSRII